MSFHDISAGPQIGTRQLLQRLNLKVCEGEFVALRGPNGIGKSTLLRLLAGIERPRTGEIGFKGIPLADIDWPGLAGGIAFLHQEPELSGSALLENSFSSRHKVMQNQPWATDYLNGWDGTVGGYWTLSSGERALASLLIQIQAEPSLLVLDEPSTRIPTSLLARIIAEGRLKAPKLAGLIVSHDDELIAATCERSVYLSEQGIREGHNCSE